MIIVQTCTFCVAMPPTRWAILQLCALSYLSYVSEAEGNLALIQTSLLFSRKCKQVSIKTT